VFNLTRRAASIATYKIAIVAFFGRSLHAITTGAGANGVSTFTRHITPKSSFATTQMAASVTIICVAVIAFFVAFPYSIATYRFVTFTPSFVVCFTNITGFDETGCVAATTTN